MVTYRTHSIEFKRQVVQEFLSGETLHGLAKRHELPRNLPAPSTKTWRRPTRCRPMRRGSQRWSGW
ncbi:hypothetical protein NKH98_28460 [Mesorhizobium sp. M0833]|uniref:hypothetical protein n=1 Tax=Mesorhizobium sp. M0833 TaxID=2957009 RepID=UPI003336D4FA